LAILFSPYFRATDQANQPVPGAFLTFYATTTSTLQPIWADQGLSVALSNPQQADGNGVFSAIWLDDSLPPYKIVLQHPDQNDPTIPGAIVSGAWGTIDPYNAAFVLSQTTVANAFYPRTSAEIAASTTPTFTLYAPSPMADVRRYLTAWDDGSDQTAGLQTAINMAYSQKGRLIFPNGLNIKCSGVSLPMSGNAGNQGFAIEGPGYPGALITKVGSPTALFTFTGATPTGNPTESPLIIEGFSVNGVDNTAHGVSLVGIGSWALRDLRLYNCAAGVNLSSALNGLIQRVESVTNHYGLLAQTDGAGSPCNRVSVRDSRFQLNTTQGIYLSSGSGWLISGCNMEGNGTAADTTTGGMRIQSGIAGILGVSNVALKSTWFESNLGQPFNVENCTGLILSIEDCNFLSGESNREVNIDGASRVHMARCFGGAGGDIFTFGSSISSLDLEQCSFSVLNDTSVMPFYKYVQTNAAVYNGRLDTTGYTGTLTGVTATTTGAVYVTQQGTSIRLFVPSNIIGTSNTTACTLTGMPAKYRPSVIRRIDCYFNDAGADCVAIATIGTDGVITFTKPGGLTNSGNKGIPGGTQFPTYDL